MKDPMRDDEPIRGRELADLLPFYATGAIDRRDGARVAEALAMDEALRRELAVVEDERHSVTAVNESLGVPSRQARERFLAMLDAQPARRKASGFDPAGWIAARLEGLRPRTLAWSGVAAFVLLAAQAGTIGLMMAPKPGFETASVAPGASGPAEGAMVVVAFAPDARVADIAKLLEGVRGTIVAGPMPGGLYRLRVGSHAPSADETRKIIATLTGQPALVRFAAPGDEAE